MCPAIINGKPAWKKKKKKKIKKQNKGLVKEIFM